MTKLFLVTINYNGSRDTVALARSLTQQTDSDFYVVVVDNGSRKEEADALHHLERAPSVHVVYSGENLGFSGGNNIGMRYAFGRGADWVLLINNDTHVDPDFIVELKHTLGESQGIIGLPIREGDQVAYAGKVRWLSPTLKHSYEPVAEGENFYAIGAGIAIDRSAFQEVGGMDERFFLYFEDADYSLKARERGVSLRYITTPEIHHQISRSTRKLGSPLLLRYHYRNMFLFNRNHAPKYIQLMLIPWAFFGIVKQVMKILLIPSARPESKAILYGILDYVFGRYGKLHA